MLLRSSSHSPGNSHVLFSKYGPVIFLRNLLSVFKVGDSVFVQKWMNPGLIWATTWPLS